MTGPHFGLDEPDADCPECEGTGEVIRDDDREHTCPRCGGSGCEGSGPDDDGPED